MTNSEVATPTIDLELIRAALLSGLNFAQSQVDDEGGIDACEMQNRIGLERITAALASLPPAQSLDQNLNPVAPSAGNSK